MWEVWDKVEVQADSLEEVVKYVKQHEERIQFHLEQHLTILMDHIMLMMATMEKALLKRRSILF